MMVGICYKFETKLDDEEINNVKDVEFYEDFVEIIFNNKEEQYEKGIKTIKSIPRELLNSLYIKDF